MAFGEGKAVIWVADKGKCGAIVKQRAYPDAGRGWLAVVFKFDLVS